MGVLRRLEFELPSGLIVRARLTKEEYQQLGLAEGCEVSFQIKAYRVLAHEGDAFTPETSAIHQLPPNFADGI